MNTYTVRITYKTDQEHTIDFPLTIEEITFKQFVEFRAREDMFFKSNLEDEDGNIIQVDPAQRVIDSLDRMLETLSELVTGDLKQLPVASPGEDVNVLYEEGFMYTGMNLWTTELNLVRLYIHCVNIIRYYEPEEVYKDVSEYKIDWRGKTYQINQEEAVKSLLGLSFTAGEAITVLEFQKKAHQLTEKHGDQDGNLAFNLGLQELAVLLRLPGEKLPVQRRKRIRFIDKRAKLFADIPLDVVMDVRFFFLHILTSYIKTRCTNFSSRVDPKVIPLRRSEQDLNKHKSRNLFGKLRVGNLFTKSQ